MKCVICGNNIKDGLVTCPICGSNQAVNNSQNQQFMYYNQPSNLYQQPPYFNQQYNQYPQMNIYNNNVVPKNKSVMDIISVVASGIGIYYLFSLIVVINNGLQQFINETFNTPDMVEILEEPLVTALCMTWPLYLAPIIGLIFGVVGRTKKQNRINFFGIVSNVILLCAGILATIYIYNFIVG